VAKGKRRPTPKPPEIPPEQRAQAARIVRATGRSLPTTAELAEAVRRDRYRHRFFSVMRSTFYSLLVVAAVAILVATLWMPVLEIYGASMTPTLREGEIVVAEKGGCKTGDVVALYYENKVLVKRVIALPGDWVNIMEDGTVSVNGATLDEPYLSEKSLGTCDIELPYQVPAGKIFVMGDQRETSIDSRSSRVGCIAEDQIVGRILFCVWPLQDIRKVG
jgi:signal peptidase I